MMLGQLRDLIRADAKLPGERAMQVWLNEIIQLELNTLTAQMRYQELRLTSIPLSLISGSVLLPENVQHINLETVRYRPGGDEAQEYYLINRYVKIGENIGATRYIYRQSDSLVTYPTELQVASDRILIDYWAYPQLVEDIDEIPIPGLVNTLRQRVLAQAVLHSDSKRANLHRDMAREAHGMSFGAVDVNDQ